MTETKGNNPQKKPKIIGTNKNAEGMARDLAGGEGLDKSIKSIGDVILSGDPEKIRELNEGKNPHAKALEEIEQRTKKILELGPNSRFTNKDPKVRIPTQEDDFFSRN